MERLAGAGVVAAACGPEHLDDFQILIGAEDREMPSASVHTSAGLLEVVFYVLPPGGDGLAQLVVQALYSLMAVLFRDISIIRYRSPLRPYTSP